MINGKVIYNRIPNASRTYPEGKQSDTIRKNAPKDTTFIQKSRHKTVKFIQKSRHKTCKATGTADSHPTHSKPFSYILYRWRNNQSPCTIFVYSLYVSLSGQLLQLLVYSSNIDPHLV